MPTNPCRRALLPNLTLCAAVTLSLAATAEESGGHHRHGHRMGCESRYEYQTLTWNPPFAEARLKSTLEKLAAAGQAGFRIVQSLPDGTGGEMLVLEKRVRVCAK